MVGWGFIISAFTPQQFGHCFDDDNMIYSIKCMVTNVVECDWNIWFLYLVLVQTNDSYI